MAAGRTWLLALCCWWGSLRLGSSCVPLLEEGTTAAEGRRELVDAGLPWEAARRASVLAYPPEELPFLQPSLSLPQIAGSQRVLSVGGAGLVLKSDPVQRVSKLSRSGHIREGRKTPRLRIPGVVLEEGDGTRGDAWSQALFPDAGVEAQALRPIAGTTALDRGEFIPDTRGKPEDEARLREAFRERQPEGPTSYPLHPIPGAPARSCVRAQWFSSFHCTPLNYCKPLCEAWRPGRISGKGRLVIGECRFDSKRRIRARCFCEKQGDCSDSPVTRSKGAKFGTFLKALERRNFTGNFNRDATSPRRGG